MKNKIEITKNLLRIETSKEFLSFIIANIVYIETCNGYSYIFIKGEKLEGFAVKECLCNMQPELEAQGLMRVSRNFMLNPAFIISHSKHKNPLVSVRHFDAKIEVEPKYHDVFNALFITAKMV